MHGHFCVQGDNLLLCLPAQELQPDAKPTCDSTSEVWHAPVVRKAGRGAFWQQWNLGKPILVTNVHGEMTWTPHVCTSCFQGSDPIHHLCHTTYNGDYAMQYNDVTILVSMRKIIVFENRTDCGCGQQVSCRLHKIPSEPCI
jgi:hypothetical protein